MGDRQRIPAPGEIDATIQRLRESPKGNPLSSATKGALLALANNGQMLTHPVSTAKSLIEALRSPKQTAKAAVEGIKEGWQADPIELLAETFIPTPGPGNLRKVVVSGDLALPVEREALHAAQHRLPADTSFQNLVREVRQSGTRDERIALSLLQDKYAQDFDGWYPGWDARMRKDIGHPRFHLSPLVLGEEGDLLRFEDLLHPDHYKSNELVNRLRGNGFRPPRVLLDGSTAGEYRPWDKEIRLGQNLDQDFLDNALEHELQHYIQDISYYAPGFRGSNPEIDGFRSYLLDNGEVEARIAALRRQMKPEHRKVISQPRMEVTERELLQDMNDPDLWPPILQRVMDRQTMYPTSPLVLAQRKGGF